MLPCTCQDILQFLCGYLLCGLMVGLHAVVSCYSNTDKCLFSQMPKCQNANSCLLHYMLEGATILIWSSVSPFLLFSSSNSQPSAMAEHLGIEFMGMKQSILTLSPSLATTTPFILHAPAPSVV